MPVRNCITWKVWRGSIDRRRWLVVTLVLVLWSCAAVGGAQRDAMKMERRGEVKAGKVRLMFSMPAQAEAYSRLLISYRLSGSGKVAVEAAAHPESKAREYYSHFLPHRFRLKVRFVSQDEKWARFEIANQGDTLWRVQACAEPGNPSEVVRDLLPGKTLERMMLRREEYKFDFGGEKLRVAFKPAEVGQVKTVEDTRAPLSSPYRPQLSQFMHAYAVHEFKGHASGVLRLQLPPWQTQVIVRLLTEREARGTAVPIKVATAYLKLKGRDNQRWTLNGKQAIALTYAPSHNDPDAIRAELKRFQKMLGDFILLVWWPPDSRNVAAIIAGEMGIKIVPKISYVRQAGFWEPWSGKKFMRAIPNPKDGDDRGRIDALDPLFPEVVADYVDILFREFGDILYRTADGKVPIDLCAEASYGYALAHDWPTRWGGGTKEDVAAFQDWLRHKYQGEIDRLNLVWQTNFRDFSEIDPSPICQMTPSEYPQPWREWSPALEDFDRFRTWLWSQFYIRIGVAIRKRHPEALLGINAGFADFASEGEPMYGGIEEWGLGINWNARRTATMPEGLLWADFLYCWNTASENGARKLCRFWRTWNKDVVLCPRDRYYAGRLGSPPGNLSRFDLEGVIGDTPGVEMAMYPIWKGAWEESGIVVMPHDGALSVMNEWHEREAKLFVREMKRALENANRTPTASSTTRKSALSVYRRNPHYFQDSKGKPVVLIGNYTWGTFSDVDYDYKAMFDTLKANELNFARIWVWWGCEKFPEPINRLNVNPYLRPGPGSANDGKPKYDLTKFNPAFFERLRAVCAAARERGIFLQLTLFDAWMIKHRHLWRLHAYHRDNNINGVDGDPKNTGTGTDRERGFCSLGNPKVMEAQKAFIRKVVDAVNEFDNIFFEIANENYYNSEWERHLCQFIHEYEKSKPKQHLVMPLDLPNHDYGGIKTYDIGRLHANLLKARALKQPLIFDTDGIGCPEDATVRKAVWTAFVSGGHVDYLDDSLQIGTEHKGDFKGSRRAVLREQLGYLARFTKQVRFWEMQPAPELVKTGNAFALASANEVVAYLPDGGSVTLDLTNMKGKLTARWFNPHDGRFGEPFKVEGGGERKFQAPDGNDWVLHLRK